MLKVNLKRSWSERRAFQAARLFRSSAQFVWIFFFLQNYSLDSLQTGFQSVWLCHYYCLFYCEFSWSGHPPPFYLSCSLCFMKTCLFVCLFFHFCRHSIVSRKNVCCSRWFKRTLLKRLSRSISLYFIKAFKAADAAAESLCFAKLFSKVFLFSFCFFFLSFFLLNLGYLTEVTFPWLPDLPWTWVHFSAVAQMFYKLPPVASEWRASQFLAPAARVARGPVWMCTLYLNPCFSSHAEILQGLICCCLSSLDVSWPTLY